jgi:predicted nucleotide-binding protein
MPDGTTVGERSRKSGPKRQFPAHPLEEALTIVRAIADQNAGREMDRLLLAKALQRTPASSDFRWLLSSSHKYGLTEGSEKSDFIVPTALGLRIAKPTTDKERQAAVKQAALTPELFGRILQHYNKNKLPQGQFFRNALERTFNVPAEYSEELAHLVYKNAQFAGLLEDIQGSQYVRIDAVPAGSQVRADQTGEEGTPNGRTPAMSVDAPQQEAEGQSAEHPARRRQIFVAHGKNRKAMEDLAKILDQFKIPYKVAISEPHLGRPISQKVAELMNACNAAIFVFTKDEEFSSNGETIWRPSENIIYELGAASVLYGTKIIIFKEEGIKFASDFQDLGYITFGSGELATKAVDLLRELVALNFVRIEAA